MPIGRRTAVLAALAGVVAATATACGGSSGGTATVAPASAAPTVSATPDCAAPAHARPVQWPAAVPADLPKPPNAHIEDSQTAEDGVHIVKFWTPGSLRDSVLFVVGKLPKAGYVLGRGDAEAVEADAPFVHGNIRGLIRMVELAPCRTEWLLAVVDTQAGVTTPLLPSHNPSGSPSPLPFG